MSQEPDPSNTPIEELTAPLTASVGKDPSNTPIEELVEPLTEGDDARERLHLLGLALSDDERGSE